MMETQELVVPKSMPTTGPAKLVWKPVKIEVKIVRTVDFLVHVPREHGPRYGLENGQIGA
jgi:hypothetical protein